MVTDYAPDLFFFYPLEIRKANEGRKLLKSYLGESQIIAPHRIKAVTELLEMAILTQNRENDLRYPYAFWRFYSRFCALDKPDYFNSDAKLKNYERYLLNAVKPQLWDYEIADRSSSNFAKRFLKINLGNLLNEEVRF